MTPERRCDKRIKTSNQNRNRAIEIKSKQPVGKTGARKQNKFRRASLEMFEPIETKVRKKGEKGT